MTDHDANSAPVAASQSQPGEARLTKNKANRSKTTESNPGFLRLEDQKSIAGIVVCLLAWLVGSTVLYSFNVGGLADIDQLAKHEVVFQVDMNQADWTEISALPTIGETMARRIVAYRETNGPFTSLQSLSLVEGIGVHTINSIQAHVADLTVSDKMVVDAG